MRTNLPVTNIEYILNDAETIVSKTDLKGNITYVNQDFINISGFSEHELLGAPQNIVRHPDMPAEAFADFWHTLKAGKAWTGMVKNRCKNGDHYWVEANAAPMLENGQIIGYTSIRLKPTREQVRAAEQAYREIKSGNTAFEIREGQAVQRSIFRRLNIATRFSLTLKIGLPFILLALLFMFNIATGMDNLPSSIASVCGLLLALLSAVLLIRAIVTPLRNARQDLERMSAGDLTGKIESSGNDDLAKVMQALRVLQTNVKLLVGQIKESTDIVTQGAQEIALGNADLSARTEAQASALEETASSMEELTSTVKQNAENAFKANQVVASTSDIAIQGGKAVRQVVVRMGSIKESSSKIVDIIAVIDGIAFQTNILALNAAVEAARAGDQGRGFAVVAAEVRTLARRSADAAREIKILIGDSVEKVDDGAKLVDDAGDTMDMIVASFREATSYVGDITSASVEQSSGIEQVNQAIMQMDDTTQQNSALVEQAAAAAASLQEQAVKLAFLVNSFKLVPGAPGIRGARIGRIKTPHAAGRIAITSPDSSATHRHHPPLSRCVQAAANELEIIIRVALDSL